MSALGHGLGLAETMVIRNSLNPATLEKDTESVFGKEAKFQPCLGYVPPTPNMRHSPADVGYLTDFVCSTINMRHSGRGRNSLKVTQSGL